MGWMGTRALRGAIRNYWLALWIGLDWMVRGREGGREEEEEVW